MAIPDTDHPLFNSCIWKGVEVEHTPFHGMKTLFVVPFEPNSATHESLVYSLGTFSGPNGGYYNIEEYEHIYLGAVKLTDMTNSARLIDFAFRLLQDYKKKVTIEFVHNEYLLFHCSTLRQRFDLSFCMLLRIVVPDNLDGGFAIKVVPPMPFSKNPSEDGVIVMEAPMKSLTRWHEYKNDKPA